MIGNQFLQAYILADDISGPVQDQQCQQPAHSSVPIVERMNAEEIQNKDGHQEERIQVRVFQSFIEFVTEHFHRFRRFPC